MIDRLRRSVRRVVAAPVCGATHAVRAGVIFALISAFASALRGQELRGTVSLPGGAPAAGAIVIATDARGIVVSRGLTTESGDFAFGAIEAGRYELRVLRIGYLPTLIPEVNVAPREVRVVHVTVRADRVSLAAVTVQGERICRMNTDSAQLVATLWNEARNAITATQLSIDRSNYSVRGVVYDRVTNLSATEVIATRADYFAGTTLRPFASLPADSLARIGYSTSVGGTEVYRAPDADALLSDSFVALHCFHIEPPPPDRSGWIGIGFTALRDRGRIVDIAGTLWIDRSSSELRELEFVYTNLPREFGPAKAGGTMEFARLSDGTWVISRWAVRMPRVRVVSIPRTKLRAGGTDRTNPSAATELGVDGIHFAGGDVVSIDRDGAHLWSGGRSLPQANDSRTNDVVDYSLCGLDPKGNPRVPALHGRIVDRERITVGTPIIVISWIPRPGDAPESRQISSSQFGDWSLCDAPRGSEVTIRASANRRASDVVTVRTPLLGPSKPVNLVLLPR